MATDKEMRDAIMTLQNRVEFLAEVMDLAEEVLRKRPRPTKAEKERLDVLREMADRYMAMDRTVEQTLRRLRAERDP